MRSHFSDNESLVRLHKKQDEARAVKALKRVMEDEPTTIHPVARALGVTQDAIEVGMPCTVKLGRWVEGPATITSFDRSKGGRVWRVRVRPEFQHPSARYERSWSFTLSDKPAIKIIPVEGAVSRPTPLFPFMAYRHGSPDLDSAIWQHRRLLVGHAEPRNPGLTWEIVQSRENGYVPFAARTQGKAESDLTTEDLLFYASTAHGVNRFLVAIGYPANRPDTLADLLGDGHAAANVGTAASFRL